MTSETVEWVRVGCEAGKSMLNIFCISDVVAQCSNAATGIRVPHLSPLLNDQLMGDCQSNACISKQHAAATPAGSSCRSRVRLRAMIK